MKNDFCRCIVECQKNNNIYLISVCSSLLSFQRQYHFFKVQNRNDKYKHIGN